MHIIIPESILPSSLERLGERHTIDYDPELVKRPDELLKRARPADAIIVRRLTQVRGMLLDVMTNCKAVGRLGVGLDNIDVETCAGRGITVVPALGANARSVAEYVITTAMMLLRTAYLSTQEVIDGKWPKSRIDRGSELEGRTLGLIGYGAIGRATAQLGYLLGMKVIAYDPRSPSDAPGICELLPLADVLTRSDVISLHVPLTPSTRHLIDEASIQCMKDGAIVINAARGGVVKEGALLAALRSRKLGGAALDAFENEPLGHSPQYEGVPNLILTPHVAGVTVQSEVRVNDVVVRGVLQALEAAK